MIYTRVKTLVPEIYEKMWKTSDVPVKKILKYQYITDLSNMLESQS